MVNRGQLSRANGRLYAVELTANQFIGPPLGGLLVGVGLVAGMAVPTALWLTAAGALLLLPGSFRVEREEKTTLRSDIKEGLKFVWNQKILRPGERCRSARQPGECWPSGWGCRPCSGLWEF
ncbi:MAG: hypothetical protein ABS909_08230 [Arthrobacter sp.]